MRFGPLASFVDRVLADKLLRGFGALGLGELAVRVSRIATTIVLARCLSAAELGIAATALACFELVRVLANNGIGQMVVRAPEERLAAMCNTAWRLSWAVCAAMAAIQISAGLVIAHSVGRPELLGMIVALAGVYAFMPWAMVHSWLLQRQYRMGRLSAVNAAQVCTDNVLTAGLAFVGLGAWAIVLPKLLTAPIWTIGMRSGVRWRYDRSAGTVGLSEIVRFSAPILASEMLVAVRFNIDKMLVGAILGIEALGIYYFAFSAGYGLSLVLTSALSAAAFPHLADHRLSGRELLARFDRALLKLALPITGLIGLQSLAVFVYVPLLFGQKWEPITAIVSVLCLSAATKAWHDLSAQLLRAAGLPAHELMASGLFTVVLLGSFSVGLTQGLLVGVAMISITAISMQLTFTAWARRVVARRLEVERADRSKAVDGLAAGRA